MNADLIDQTLDARGGVYGDYYGMIRLRATLMDAIQARHYNIHGCEMNIVDEEHIRDIVLKLTRLAASPRHLDTWHDIVGYSTLVENELKESSSERDT